MSKYQRYFAAIMGKRIAEVHHDELPELQPDELLVKMETCNICTTDYQQWLGLRDHQGFPMAGGHENCGIIIEKGAGVIDDFQIGDRIGSGGGGCGVCKNCRSGHTGDCQNPIYGQKPYNVKSSDGFYGNKGFANYAIVKQRVAVKVTKEIPAAEASFIEPIATAVQGIKKVDVRPMSNVVVVGAGTMGLVNAQVAKAWGGRVIVCDISDKKVERARQMGIGEVIHSKEMDPVQKVKELTNGQGADIVIAAVGNSIAYRQAYQMLKPFRGKMLFFAAGYPKPELEIDPNELHYRKIELIGTVTADSADFIDAGVLLSQKLVCMRYSLEGKTFALRDIQKAYEAAATPNSYRITVDLQQVDEV